MPRSLAGLRTDLLELFQQPIDRPLDDEAFDNLARDIFAYQYERNAPYRAYCERRGRPPSSVTHWSQIPPVPTAAFKEVALVAGDARNAEAVFRTSGTTAGSDRRGSHYIPDLSIYNASLLPNFSARLLPDDARMPMLSLIPRSSEMPDSSLAHMVALVMDELGDERSAYYATVSDGIDTDALHNALNAFTAAGTALCILGTSFSFVHWLDELKDAGRQFALPMGSRLMDTGGYKGRSREVPAGELRASYEQLLGIPADACINEYGMTELCSQMYDSTLSEKVRDGSAGMRRKLPPPWLRVRIVDPVTLEPVDTGTSGLVQLFDLANIGSVVAVQTEDLGVQVGDGYELLGRIPGAQPRGCSIAMDDMLQAVRRT